mmetsp:Transcript_35248/g.110961  ORF Transcript_35248/g.110961 Transcript_35248/m.110961 type:complete len:1129 (-) Transcript_35248:2965-6351(-)
MATPRSPNVGTGEAKGGEQAPSYHQSYTGTLKREKTLRAVRHTAFSTLEEEGAEYGPLHSPLRKGEFKDLYPAEGLEIGSVVYRYEDRFSFQRLIKRNSLVFDSHFESGNLNSVVRLPDYEGVQQYMLELSHDVHTKGHIQWYYFSVGNTSANQEVCFYVRGFSKKDSLYNYGMRPLMFSEMNAASEGSGWRRVGEDIKYGEDPFHGRRSPVGPSSTYTLSFRVTFEFSNDVCFFAHSHPYTYMRLQQELRQIEQSVPRSPSEASDIFLERDMLTETLGRNCCDIVTVSSRTAMQDPARGVQRPHIVISARVHPGETCASWMMEGVLRYLTSNDPGAADLRDAFVFKVVPMLNPDGVINGNYRTSLAGVDLNRRWDHPHPRLHPTIYSLKMLMADLKAEGRLALIVDLHGHSRKEAVFMYGCVPDKKWIAYSNNSLEENPNVEEWTKEGTKERFAMDIWAARLLPRVLATRSRMFSFEDCNFAMQPSKQACMRMVCCNELKCPLAYTLEASFSGRNGVHFSHADLRSLGNELCRSMLDISPILYDRYEAEQSRLQAERRALEFGDGGDSVEGSGDGGAMPVDGEESAVRVDDLSTLMISSVASTRGDAATAVSGLGGDASFVIKPLPEWRIMRSSVAALVDNEKSRMEEYCKKLCNGFPRAATAAIREAQAFGSRIRPKKASGKGRRKKKKGATTKKKKKSLASDMGNDDESVGSDSAPSDDNFDPMELLRCVRNAGLPADVTTAAAVIAKSPQKTPKPKPKVRAKAPPPRRPVVPEPPNAPPPMDVGKKQLRIRRNSERFMRPRHARKEPVVTMKKKSSSNVFVSTMTFEGDPAMGISVGSGADFGNRVQSRAQSAKLGFMPQGRRSRRKSSSESRPSFGPDDPGGPAGPAGPVGHAPATAAALRREARTSHGIRPSFAPEEQRGEQRELRRRTRETVDGSWYDRGMSPTRTEEARLLAATDEMGIGDSDAALEDVYRNVISVHVSNNAPEPRGPMKLAWSPSDAHGEEERDVGFSKAPSRRTHTARRTVRSGETSAVAYASSGDGGGGVQTSDRFTDMISGHSEQHRISLVNQRRRSSLTGSDDAAIYPGATGLGRAARPPLRARTAGQPQRRMRHVGYREQQHHF